MPHAIRYAITNGARFGDDVNAAVAAATTHARACASAGVDFLQLREKHLPSGLLLALAQAVAAELRAQDGNTRLLVNGRADVAAAAGAHGVHLPSSPGELTPAAVRQVFARAGLPHPIVSVSCHSESDVARARNAAADLILFGPVFEKRVLGELVTEGVGLAALRAACLLAGPVPVLALGGVDLHNMGACMDAGARGVAAIRLFAGPA